VESGKSHFGVSTRRMLSRTVIDSHQEPFSSQALLFFSVGGGTRYQNGSSFLINVGSAFSLPAQLACAFFLISAVLVK